MPGLTANLQLLTPEFALASLALIVFALDLVLPAGRKHLLGWVAVTGLAALILVSLVMLWGKDETLYDGLLAVDAYSLFFKFFFMGLGILIIFSSIEYVSQYLENQGEFFGLLLFLIFGMKVLAQSRGRPTA